MESEVCSFTQWQQIWLNTHCSLNNLDSRAKQYYWVKKEWPTRENMVVGEKNVIHKALVVQNKIILPPGHIKLNLMK